jgi:hypothetical protein
MRTPITLIKLTTPDVPDESLLDAQSWILSGMASFFDLRGYFFLAPHLKKDASLGVLFEEIRPDNDGSFELEIGAILPDLFPNIDSKPEYVLAVDMAGTTRDVCFSNIMSRLRFTKDEHLLHALTPRRSLSKVRDGEYDFIPPEASVELLRTFATCRYSIKGDNAEEALENSFESCIHDLIERLNKVLKAMPFVDMGLGRVYSIAYSRAGFSCFYFILKGEDEEKLGHGWISPHVGRTLLNPPDLDAEHSSELRQYLAGTRAVDDVEAILHSAQTFLDGGVLDYTLLLSVIAAEVVTQRYVYERLSSSVSKTKLNKSQRDLTYSLMLNVILPSLVPDGQEIAPELIEELNRGRRLRNNLMHEGAAPTDAHEITNLLAATHNYVEQVRKIRECTDTTEETTSEEY